ncbi:MAG: ATP-binding cassette domain-containing protein [Corallococcus sp.]|nr:ATP-binding cassette domain-containing protein [Corallococcus sp.]
MSVILRGVNQRYPDMDKPVYKDFSAEFATGKIHAVLGASGSGKTTLLNIIADVCDYGGEVEKGEVSYVFQEPRLIEDITVRRNLQLVLNSKIKDRSELKRKTEEALCFTEIERYADAYPDKLSGGERQRVSLARAFAYPSDVLLMDEPFVALDYGVKTRLMKQFLDLNSRFPRTVIFVTHDVDEAIAIADELYLLQGSPSRLTHIAALEDGQAERDVYADKYVALKKSVEQILLSTSDK